MLNSRLASRRASMLSSSHSSNTAFFSNLETSHKTSFLTETITWAVWRLCFATELQHHSWRAEIFLVGPAQTIPSFSIFQAHSQLHQHTLSAEWAALEPCHPLTKAISFTGRFILALQCRWDSSAIVLDMSLIRVFGIGGVVTKF